MDSSVTEGPAWLHLKNPATRLAFKVGLATALSSLVGLWMHLQDPFWVGVSGFLVCMDQAGNSINKTFMRVLYTLIGAGLGILVCHFFIESPVLFILISFLIMTYSIYRGFRDDQFYVWIFTSLTFFMVASEVLATGNPLAALNAGLYRSLDIIVGCVVGLAVALTVFPIRAGTLLKEELPRFLEELVQYYSQPQDPAKIVASLARITAIKEAAQKESIFFERSRSAVIEQVEKLSLAVKELQSFAHHLEAADLSYMHLFEPEVASLRAVFQDFLRAPTDAHLEKAEQAIAVLHHRYDVVRREGANFRFSPHTVTVFLEWVALHQLLCDLIKAAPSKRQPLFQAPMDWGAHLRQNRFYLLYAFKIGLGLIIFPLLWVQLALPGATQIGVSMSAVLNVDFNTSKHKSWMRFWGCMLGAGISLFTLMVLRVESLFLLMLITFFVAYFCSFLHNSTSKYAYLGTQAIVAFLMGTIVSVHPSLIPDFAVERFVDVTGGVLFLSFILNYLSPFKPRDLLLHYCGQVEKAFERLGEMGQAYCATPSFDLIRSMEGPLRLLKRDLAQLAQQHPEAGSYQSNLRPGFTACSNTSSLRCGTRISKPYPNIGLVSEDALRQQYCLARAAKLPDFEAFLIFVSLHAKKLGVYQVWVQKALRAFSAMDPQEDQAFQAQLSAFLEAVRSKTAAGQFLPLEEAMTLGAVVRMCQRLFV